MSQDNIEFNDNRVDDEQEIDMLELASKLWSARRRIFKWAGIGAILGLIVAFSIPKEYTASVTLAPEWGNSKANSQSGLGMLASMAGININQGQATDAVYPQLYPDVISSVPFTVGLLKVELPTNIEDTDSATVESLLVDHTRSPWWGFFFKVPGMIIGGIKSLFVDDEETKGDGSIDPYRLTLKQSRLVESLNKRIDAIADTKTLTVVVSTTMQDPVAAATLADTVVARLSKFVTEYRTGKARKDLEYARKINEEARLEYYKAQQRYAAAVDRNHGLSTRSAAIELERLQNESQLAFSLYNTTAQQEKMAEAKVQENTPVFAVVKPATVPVKPSKPRKVLILFGYVFLAVVAACAYTLFAPKLIESIKSIGNNSQQQ